jgi:DNA-binding transcriptional MerR regulator
MTNATTELVPIDEVAQRLGLRASAIRYYEERGLIAPAPRHSGRRWYRPADIRRLAIIQSWQESGLMSLEEIGEILAGPTAARQWKQVVEDRLEALRRRSHGWRRHGTSSSTSPTSTTTRPTAARTTKRSSGNGTGRTTT